MVTDHTLNYFFKSQVKMKTQEGERDIVMMKKIHPKNPYFSMSYEYIYHEILKEFDFPVETTPSLYVIEILDNFEEGSEIYKLAKEKFIESLYNTK